MLEATKGSKEFKEKAEFSIQSGLDGDFFCAPWVTAISLGPGFGSQPLVWVPAPKSFLPWYPKGWVHRKFGTQPLGYGPNVTQGDPSDPAILAPIVGYR